MQTMPGRAASLLLATIALAQIASTGCQPGAEIPIQGYNINSIGAQDFDGDGVPDLYTTNHNAAPSILLGATTPWREIPHDPRFPALADLPVEPPTPETGALLYWHQSRLEVVAGELAEPVTGSLTFLAEPASAVSTTSADEPRVEALDEDRWRVVFTLSTGTKLVVTHDPPIPGWPVRLQLTSDPSVLSIGRAGDHPDEDTEFRLRDYHVLVAEDIDVDGDVDVVALGGGMRGRAAELAPDAAEQTFVNEGSRLVPLAGPPKAGCATRGAIWEDDALRIFCARGQTDNVWRWEGGWTGGSDGRTTPFGRPWCSWRTLLKYRVAPFASRSNRRLCVEADFDDDQLDELVVATFIYPGVSTAKLYD